MASMVWKSLLCRTWIHQLRCWSQSGKHYVHSWTRILWALLYYLNYTIHINMLNRRGKCALLTLTAHWTFDPWRLWLLTAECSCFHTNDWRYRILLQRDSYFILKNSVTHLYLCPSCNSVLWIFKSIMYSTYSLWKNTVHISSSCSEIHVLAVRYTVKSLAGTPADIKK